MVVAKGPVVVAEGARIEGRVECGGDVIVAGAVAATGLSRMAIECHGKLILARSAHVAGNARFRTLETYRGASIQGVLTATS
jgi:cytoskeletal protein CcmA (bactofilin family)